METIQTYSSYPLRYVLIYTAFTVSIYALGTAIVAGAGWWAAALYLLYCLAMEINLLRRSCRDSVYYGSACASGKGRLCAVFFKRGDPARFAAREISWKMLIPDMLVVLIPAAAGAVLLVIDFSWWRAVLMAAIIVLSFAGNAVVHTTFACKYCRQREIGCPAERLFSKEA